MISSYSVSTGIWYQNIGIQLSKVVFPRVDDWLTGLSGFEMSHFIHVVYKNK